jgi:hypothetical protein
VSEPETQTVDEAANEYRESQRINGVASSDHYFGFLAGAAWAKQSDPDVVALVEAAKEVLKTCRVTTTGPMRVNMVKVHHMEQVLARFEKGKV